MTEAEWRACTDPERMLEFLRGKATDRKLRLFACAWVRRMWNVVEDERSRAAVEVAERTADGLATAGELESARTAAHEAAFNGMVAGYAAMATALPWGDGAAEATADPNDNYYDSSVEALYYDWSLARQADYSASDQQAWMMERAAQAGLLRDIFANPFRSVAPKSSWHISTVLALAQVAYDNRLLPTGTLEPAYLAVLADALEETGCDNKDILSHLRQPGVHVRGCWALDLILGKE